MFMYYGKGQERHPFLVCRSCPYSAATQIRASSKPTLYEVLDISEKATLGEIRDAFITKSKQLHPDMNPLKPELHEKFVQINNAYSVLSNASHRLEYDRRLREIPVTKSSTTGASPFGSVPHHRQSPYSYYYEKATSDSNYRQTRPNDFAAPPPFVNSAQRQKTNRLIVVGVVAFMLIGATTQYYIIRLRHNKIRARADESSRQALQHYTDARERARTNGLRKQLELLLSHHSGLEKLSGKKALQRWFGDKNN